MLRKVVLWVGAYLIATEHACMGDAVFLYVEVVESMSSTVTVWHCWSVSCV